MDKFHKPASNLIYNRSCMEEDYKEIGRLMKAARKFQRENQESVSKAIGCSQSALSKLEHGTLVPSAPQWFLFCRHLHIPVTSLETGSIDRHIPIITLEEASLIKWPKRYRNFRGLKSRELYPFVSYLKALKGDAAVEKMFEELGLDIDLSVDFDHQINHLLLFDVIQYFIKNDISSHQEIRDIAQRYALPAVHGELYREYAKIHDIRNIVELFIKEQKYYQIDVKLKVEEIQHGRLNLVLNHERYFDSFIRDTSPEVLDFYCNYYKFKIEALLAGLTKEKVTVRAPENSAPRGFPERYEIEF